MLNKKAPEEKKELALKMLEAVKEITDNGDEAVVQRHRERYKVIAVKKKIKDEIQL